MPSLLRPSLLLFALALPLTACGGGGGGDQPLQPQAQTIEIVSTADRDGFTTGRRLPGSVSGAYASFPWIQVGEIDETVFDRAIENARGYLSFDLAGIRDLRVKKATLYLTQVTRAGNPWLEFGTSGLVVDRVSIGTDLDKPDHDARPLTPGMPARVLPVADGEEIALDVTIGVRAQLAVGAADPILDLRLAFPDSEGLGNDLVTDFVHFGSGESATPPRLVIELE